MDRDRGLEGDLTTVAAQSAGRDGRGLSLFADRRAEPGPVRMDGRDLMHEAAEELADCRNYLVWRAQEMYPGFLAGDAQACGEYDRAMRTLAAVVVAFDEMHTRST